MTETANKKEVVNINKTNISVAIFRIGADEIRRKQMDEFIRNKFNFAGEYFEEKKLLADAEKRKFTHVFVFDKDAIDNLGKLSSLNVEVVSFKEREKLNCLFKKEIFHEM